MRVTRQLGKSTKSHSTNNYILGVIEFFEVNVFHFPLKLLVNSYFCCPADYSWKSNRWSGNQETHCIDVTILIESDSFFDIARSSSSEPFKIISNKKQRRVEKAARASTSKKQEAVDEEEECGEDDDDDLENTLSIEEGSLLLASMRDTSLVKPSCYEYDRQHQYTLRKRIFEGVEDSSAGRSEYYVLERSGSAEDSAAAAGSSSETGKRAKVVELPTDHYKNLIGEQFLIVPAGTI